MSCNNCGAQDRLYGFCEKCWEKIWTGVDAAKTRYEEDLSAGPLDPRGQQMLFDSFVKSLWKVFKTESREKHTEKPKDKPKYVLLTEDDVIEATDEEWEERDGRWLEMKYTPSLVGRRFGDVFNCGDKTTLPYRRRINKEDP